MNTSIAQASQHTLLPDKQLRLRVATEDDLEALVALENSCFDHDRLSRRSFKRWLKADHGILWLIEIDEQVVAYGLVWCHKGTSLARLYSLALSHIYRGKGIAEQLLLALEGAAAERGKVFMRLEVAKNNAPAIGLYQRLGYRVFGEYCDYYDDHSDALRMQKTIQRLDDSTGLKAIRWYQQTTEFTCGPAALMMAISGVDSTFLPCKAQELDIWREATTIFMTSGHGGCHPVGLALAAQRRGLSAMAYINSDQPLFLEGVRSKHKKEVMTFVHQQFISQAEQSGLPVFYENVNQQQVTEWLEGGCAVIMLISTYQLDGRKSPHWVTITHIDDNCFYVHDPDLDESEQLIIDCQHLPISRQDFDRMSSFGSNRLRAAVVIAAL